MSDDDVDVRLVDVVKRFGDVTAVDGVSLDIAKGEFFSLLGPSGCGKTTTLRMIGGFEQPESGRIELGGTDVAGTPPNRRDVNTVFQSYALFPHLDIFGNVAYGLRRKGVAKEEIAGRVRDILELVDLGGYEGRRTSQLSGGQQQRVALARALVNRPRVLLLDEPLGALDLKLRKQMQLELKRIQHEVGITFIYVTHDQDEAMTMSDRLAVMRDGRVEQVGRPQEVYEQPATEFVAGFLGASNLLSGTAGPADASGRQVALASGEKIRIADEGAASEGAEIHLGVRPEKIRIGGRGRTPPSGANSIDATVVDATFVGVSNVFTVRTRTGDTMTVYAQNLGADDAPPPAAGDEVTLTWDPAHTFVVSERRDET